VRDNELAAGVIGVDVFRTKVFRLCAECRAGGLAGGLSPAVSPYVSPGSVFIARIGGVPDHGACSAFVASPSGSAIGTGLLIRDSEWLRFLKSVPGLYLAITVSPSSSSFAICPTASGDSSIRQRRVGAPVEGATGSGRAAIEACHDRRRHRAGSHRPSKHFGGLKAVDGVDIA
jgi:branched-chain amino acid transport system permease protein